VVLAGIDFCFSLLVNGWSWMWGDGGWWMRRTSRNRRSDGESSQAEESSDDGEVHDCVWVVFGNLKMVQKN
jgi:hypothetical protein